MTKQHSKVFDEKEVLQITMERVQTTLRNRQMQNANLQKQIDEQAQVRKKNQQEIKELKGIIEAEREKHQKVIAENEAQHKKKYDQLKHLVEQYKSEMEQFVKITQVNQDIMGRINIEGNINNVFIDPCPTTEEGGEQVTKHKRK